MIVALEAYNFYFMYICIFLVFEEVSGVKLELSAGIPRNIL